MEHWTEHFENTRNDPILRIPNRFSPETLDYGIQHERVHSKTSTAI